MAYLGTKPANQVIDSTLIADGTITPSDLSTGKPVWDTSGNLLVGTNSTSALSGYTVIGQFKNSIGIVNGSADEFAGALLRQSSSSNSISLEADPANLRANSFLGFGVDGTERMRIDSAGNVGIGTSSPTRRLEVSQSSAAGEIGAFIKNSATSTTNNTASLWFGNWENASTTGVYNAKIAAINMASINASTDLAFFTYNGNGSSSGVSERMRIASNGRVGINTTTHLWDSSERLSVLGSSIDAIAAWRATQTNGQHIFLNNTGVLAGYINWTGTSTAYITSSDYRLKENISPMTGALAKVAQLKPCTYTWKADGSNSQGFIAHELAEVCPDAVCGEKDAVNEDGSIKPQGIDTSFLVATLTAAIQELKAIVDAQAARIEILESNKE